MIKPKRLKKGDTVAVVSLSWGGLGDAELIHKYWIAKKRLEEDFGLKVITMPHALKGTEFVAKHPELRAKDLMDAFEDINIKGIICAIGGDDTIRLLPYINIDVIKKNPKIFMGYSDSTSNHLMMYKAGLVSFYGPSVMCEFGEYVSMFDYTVQAVRKFLFEDTTGYKIESSPVWSKDYIPWSEENMHTAKVLEKEDNGYEVLQGDGIVTGHLLGGCVDTFIMSNGTSIWPTIEEWTGAIMFIETSEDHPSPEILKWIFRNLAAQGILKVIHGILVGKPEGGIYYNEYKNVLLQVVKEEEHLSKLPVIYNVNFGHAVPIGILPYGIRTKLDCDNKEIILMESATKE